MRADLGTTKFSVVFNAFDENITISTSVSSMTSKIHTSDDLKSKLYGIWPSGLDNTPADDDGDSPQSVNIDLLKKIKFLLKDQGMTIKGVKKILDDNQILQLDEKSNQTIKSDSIRNKVVKISNILKDLKSKI